MPYRAGGAGPPWAILAGAAKPTHQVRRPRVDVTIGAVIVAALATFVGATIQGSLGFGMNLVTVPALALVLPEALPVAVITLGLSISIGMLRHEHPALDREIGSASCRERVWRYVYISVVAVSLTKKETNNIDRPCQSTNQNTTHN